MLRRDIPEEHSPCEMSLASYRDPKESAVEVRTLSERLVRVQRVQASVVIVFRYYLTSLCYYSLVLIFH